MVIHKALIAAMMIVGCANLAFSQPNPPGPQGGPGWGPWMEEGAGEHMGESETTSEEGMEGMPPRFRRPPPPPEGFESGEGEGEYTGEGEAGIPPGFRRPLPPPPEGFQGGEDAGEGEQGFRPNPPGPRFEGGNPPGPMGGPGAGPAFKEGGPLDRTKTEWTGVKID